MSSPAKGPQEKREHKKNGWLPANVLVPTVAVPVTKEFPRRKEEERRGMVAGIIQRRTNNCLSFFYWRDWRLE